MWHLKSIKANNLCSFLEMEYSLKQGEATLIFGSNLDSDSQNSNGSGKSALIEAISIALTGEPLRKVNVDEIINDSQNEAVISAVLSNDLSGVQMTINRRLSRKNPQLIQILQQSGPYDTETEEISLATVADYNKYILDSLGLTKEDIFANFILTARKYKSFLSSSDKEKKEIINRFSNGVLVDESIEALHADMAPIQESLTVAEKTVATCTGRVDALASEIGKVINEAVERKASTESRIANWETLIIQKRAEIRSAKVEIIKIDDSLDVLESLDSDMQAMEKSDIEATEALDAILLKFQSNGLELATDFNHEIKTLESRLTNAKAKVSEANEQVKQIRATLSEAESKHSDTITELEKKQAANDDATHKCTARLSELSETVKAVQNAGVQLTNTLSAKQRESASIEKQLAGVIQCPKCKHEFTFAAGVDIAESRKKLAEIKAELVKLAADIEANDAKFNAVVAEGKEQRNAESSLATEARNIKRQIIEADDALSSVRRQVSNCDSLVETANNNLTEIQNKIGRIRKRIFDETFEAIDEAYKRREAKIKSLETEVETLNGSIASYEKAIEDARNASEEDMLASLKKSQEQYRSDLQAAVESKNEIEGRLNELKVQEQTFIEFKTHLANSKINAIAQITNQFLETIGSDIRVALSGYTVLKSGKVRDKISVSLLRDGVDCGSFEKFSAGERVRVELASILSMNQLTNMNCEEGKGLDLLIADEVLDSADEQGLASVFKALNKTQITSLVVSHGQIGEAYPNRITIVKQNGVSSIYETNDSN